MGTEGGTARHSAGKEGPRGPAVLRGSLCSITHTPGLQREGKSGAELPARHRAAQPTPVCPTRAAFGLVLREAGSAPPWRGSGTSARPSPRFFGFGFKENLPIAGLST